MSSALGIASVTHVIKDLLNDGLINQNVASALGTAISVTSLPPAQVESAPGGNNSQLNMFMYRVTPNIGISNLGYPSRNSRGSRINNPPLALNLHYLLTAFGENELHAEILLGYGMQLLHESPVLPREAIRTSLSTATASDPNGRLPANLLALATSNLAEQIEQIKITHENINMEEMSRLWTAFQTNYRPCSAYQATVVLIESHKSTNNPLPVRQRTFYTFPLIQPNIERIISRSLPDGQELENRKITVGDQLIIQGNQLKNDPLKIVANGKSLVPEPAHVSNTELRVIIPDTWRAGVVGLQIVHFKKFDQELEMRKTAQSNLSAFVLSPLLSNPALADSDADDELVKSATLSLDVSPAIYEDQRVILLLNKTDLAPDELPDSYSFLLAQDFWDEQVVPVNSLEFLIANVKKGLYLLRIQVDGAESPLETDNQGKYTTPNIQIS